MDCLMPEKEPFILKIYAMKCGAIGQNVLIKTVFNPDK